MSFLKAISPLAGIGGMAASGLIPMKALAPLGGLAGMSAAGMLPKNVLMGLGGLAGLTAGGSGEDEGSSDGPTNNHLQMLDNNTLRALLRQFSGARFQ